MEAVGARVSSTVSPATGQVRASTPMRQAEQPLSTARVQAPEEPVPGTRRLSGLSWLRSLVAMHDREPAVKAGDTSRSARTFNVRPIARSEEHTSELQSLMRISYAVFCLKQKKTTE